MPQADAPINTHTEYRIMTPFFMVKSPPVDLHDSNRGFMVATSLGLRGVWELPKTLSLLFLCKTPSGGGVVPTGSCTT